MADKNKISILQIGKENWSATLLIPEKLKWVHLSPDDIPSFIKERQRLEVMNKQLVEQGEEALPVENYHAFFLTDEYYDDKLWQLFDLVNPHEVFYPKQLEPKTEILHKFLHLKLAQYVDINDRDKLLYVFSKALFTGQYGDKISIRDFVVTNATDYHINYEGSRYLVVEGDFGESYKALGTYVYNKSYNSDQFINLWQEKIIESSVELKIVVQLIYSGSISDIAQEWIFEGNDLEKQMEIDSEHSGYLSISIMAKGNGRIKLGPLHYRFARHGLGEFLLGGERFVDKYGQELNFYFNPRDYKPPLNVYFSGFRTAEGFEGYWMMHSLEAPYILICDPRNTGGAFYMGSDELEKSVVEYIQDKLDFLGFSNKQLNLSGLSMGTFGALYYGADLNPNAIIVSKPLVNLGTVAANERINRPGGFATSLDLLQTFDHSLSPLGVERLNQRFWEKLQKSTIDDASIIITYMQNDDYENDVYPQLIDFTKDRNITIISKGWLGRHTDSSSQTTGWFYKKYINMLKRDFKRGAE